MEKAHVTHVFPLLQDDCTPIAQDTCIKGQEIGQGQSYRDLESCT